MNVQLQFEHLEDRRLLAVVPAGFTETPVATDLTSPVTMDIDDTGRIFLAFQNGTIQVIENDQLLPTPFAILDADGSGERGLQGIELDPNHAANGYIYVYYTAATPSSHNRVSRLTIDPTTENTVIPGSELVLLDLPDLSSVGNPIWHMGGAIHFASDGTLIVQVGDHQDTSKPQDMEHPFGKLLRINPNGSIPADNPFYDLGDGITWRDTIWASGLRSPFSGDVNPTTGQVFINDVGAGSWEEINDATVGGRNFGWPITEGAFDPVSYPDFTNPVHAYSHSEDCAITGGAFYAPPLLQFPVEYHGKYFYSQFCSGRIMVLDPADPASNDVFATDAEFPMNIEFAPNGAMYYIARGAGAGGNPGTGTGRVLRIDSDIQVPPSIVNDPADTLVSVGYDATFVVEATGNQPLSYQWQSRPTEGAKFAEIAGANSATLIVPNVSLADDGSQYRAVVDNAFGNVTSAHATLSVTTDQPPAVSIDTPPEGTTYVGGQQFTFSGSAIDPEDGVLDGDSMTWQIDFHHDIHLHPFFPETTGISSGEFTIPDTGETATDVWYRIRLTVTDSIGLTTTVLRDLFPELSTFTVTSNIGDGSVLLDGSPQPAFETVTGVVGIQRAVEARQAVIDGLTAFPFVQWLDGTTDRHRTFATPTAHQNFAALYADPASSHVFLSDLDVAGHPDAGFQPFNRDKSFGPSGEPITLAGVQYQRGLGVRADSDLVVALDEEYSRFISDAGIDDQVAAGGSVRFQVLADGALVFDSGTMTGISATASIDIDVTGVNELRLVVSDAGDGNTDDYADWAAARLTKNVPTDDILINFQLDGAPIPSGYLADTGQVFGDRGNGLSYGWTSDHTDVSRDRGINPDQRLDTLVHFHDGQQWEIELPNGMYTVNTVLGDAQYDTDHTLIVEGASFWTTEHTGPNEFRQQSQVAYVTDGRLTLDVGSAADKETRINFIEISPGISETAFLPYRDADINLDGVLDAQDLADFVAAWGSDTTGQSHVMMVQQGDFNWDGSTDLADFGILRDAFIRQSNKSRPTLIATANPGQLEWGEVHRAGPLVIREAPFDRPSADPATHQIAYYDVVDRIFADDETERRVADSLGFHGFNAEARRNAL